MFDNLLPAYTLVTPGMRRAVGGHCDPCAERFNAYVPAIVIHPDTGDMLCADHAEIPRAMAPWEVECMAAVRTAEAIAVTRVVGMGPGRTPIYG